MSFVKREQNAGGCIIICAVALHIDVHLKMSHGSTYCIITELEIRAFANFYFLCMFLKSIKDLVMWATRKESLSDFHDEFAFYRGR